MRSSRASTPLRSTIICTDDVQRAALEARNALLQFDEVRRLTKQRLGKSLALTSADLLNLQRLATEGIYSTAGQYRSCPIGISNSPHEPPPWVDVPSLAQEMCDYANGAKDPLHCSAYLMWRLNWIHPFSDGNGRTSRAVSYLALGVGFGMELPGTTTVPDLIVRDKLPYYDALDAADAAWKDGHLDVALMETLIENLLAEQLRTAL